MRNPAPSAVVHQQEVKIDNSTPTDRIVLLCKNKDVILNITNYTLNLPKHIECTLKTTAKKFEQNYIETAAEIWAPNAVEFIARRLKKSGDIILNPNTDEVPTAYTNVILPMLEVCGNLIFRNVKNINLPSLTHTGDIDGRHATEMNLPELKNSGGLDFNSVAIYLTNKLVSCLYITATTSTEFSSAALRHATDIDASSAKGKVALNQLESCDNLDVGSASNVELNKLKKSRSIIATAATRILIPVLEVAEDINAGVEFFRARLLNTCSKLVLPNARNGFAPKLRHYEEIVAPKIKRLTIAFPRPFFDRKSSFHWACARGAYQRSKPAPS